MDNTLPKVEVISGSTALRIDPAPQRVHTNPQFVEQSKGSNWIHASLKVIKVTDCGFGVITTRDLPEATLLIVYGGRVITTEDFEALPHEMQHYPYQVAPDLFIGPVNSDDVGIGERINHSCNPNAGFQGAIHLIAMRDIIAGEEVTIDYATCVSANEDAFTMNCVCGSSNCRGVITGQDWQLKEVQSRLLPYYQPYLQERVRARRKRERYLR